jgi:hypothetical protein
MRAARTLAGPFVAAVLVATAGMARADGGGAAGAAGSGQHPPVRATSTVEVIDVGRGVDDIISRVRAAQREQSASPPAAAKGPAGTKAGQHTGKGEGARGRDGDDLRAERPDRPRSVVDRDKHDSHRVDRDVGRRVQTERFRDVRK